MISRTSQKLTFTLGNIGAQVTRGSISSAERRGFSQKIFHISDFPRGGCKIIDIPDNVALVTGGHIFAGPNDILIARVGRDLEHKSCVIRSGRVMITDWIYRVRIPPNWLNTVSGALFSETGRSLIRAHTRGVGPKHLSKMDLLSIPFHTDLTDADV
jgi:type I restriction enzyme M protein